MPDGPGQPSKIDKVITYRDIDGERQPVTVFDRIVGGVRMGVYHEIAAAAAGVSSSTLRLWLRLGARALTRAALHNVDVDDPSLGLTNHELRCVAFSAAVAEAEAEWEVVANGTLDRLARGGLTTTKTTTRQARQDDGTYLEIERTVVVETLAPSAQVLEWRLTRRHPARYAVKADDEATAATGEAQASDLAAEVRGYLVAKAEEQTKTRGKRRSRAVADAIG